MDTNQLEEELHISRYIIVYKFVLGLFELLLGVGIPIFGRHFIDVYFHFRSKELLEDPHDLLAMILEKIVPFIQEHQGYIVFFLVLLGLTKIVGCIGMWKKKHWGLDILILLTIILLPFQLYSLVAHPSVSKTAFFLINMFIALYLVEFKPKHYFEKVRHRIRNGKY